MLVLRCDLPVLLAYLCIIQLVAAGVYLLFTAGMDTPFKAAVAQYPDLVAIKQGSARHRRNVYILGLCVGLGIVVVYRPFQNCK
jgi:hypothetical protein